MIPNIILWIISLPIILLGAVGGLLNSIFPPWLTDGITGILGGTGILNTVLPMYPHTGMAGLAGQIGLMPIFGWLTLMMGYLIILSLTYKLVKVLLSMFSIGQGPSIGTGGR